MSEMQVPPPPLPPGAKRSGYRRAVVITLIVLVSAGGIAATVHGIVASGITRGPDNLFGDQHLKTTVALLELYKVRYGKYPASLRDLTFTGQWDEIALQSVSYYTNQERSAYYVEVQRGWMGKPTIQMPEEFWKGTGYSEELKPAEGR